MFFDPNPDIVPFKKYFPKMEDLDRKQHKFYKFFVKEIERGKYVELQDNVSYAYLYIYKILDMIAKKGESHIKDAIEELIKLKTFYSAHFDVDYWLADLYLLNGHYERALETYTAQLNPSKTQTLLSEVVLNLKFERALEVNSLELFCNEKRLTKFGLENCKDVLAFSDIILKKHQEELGLDFLQYFGAKYIKERKYDLQLFNGYPGSRPLMEILERKKLGFKTFCFYSIPEFAAFCKDLSRNAENTLREDRELPLVGEGWISETELFYRIKKHLRTYTVIPHAMLPWLGRQHLDVYVPELNLAFEYQGRQHLEPVEFFGGQEAFERTKKRDKAKKAKCTRNGVRLIEVFENYSLSSILQIIDEQVAVKRRI